MSEKHWLFKTIEMFVAHFIEEAVVKVSENMDLYTALFNAREIINGGNSKFLRLSYVEHMDGSVYQIATDSYGETLHRVKLVIGTRHGELSFHFLVLESDWEAYQKKIEILLQDLQVTHPAQPDDTDPMKLSDVINRHMCTMTDVGFSPTNEIWVLSINNELWNYNVPSN